MAIVLPGGFNITNNEPADARFSVADSSARLGLSAANVYEGLLVYQRDNDTLYVLTNASDPSQAGNWTEVGAQVDISSLNAFTGSAESRLDALELETGSIATEQALQDARLDAIEAATGSLTDSGITGSSLVTASATGDTITFTKGDGSTFPITIFTSSSLGLNTKVGFIPTSSFVAYSPGGSTQASASVEFATPFSSSDYQVVVHYPNVLATGSVFDRLVTAPMIAVVNKTTTGFGVLIDTSISVLANDRSFDNDISYIAVANGETAVTSSFTLLSATASYVEYDNVANKPTLVSSSAQVASLTGSLISTASATGDTITFTKGDGSTFPITIYTSSSLGLNTKVGNVPSASFQATGSDSYASVTFATPFSSSDYGVSLQLANANKELYAQLDDFSIENKTTSGFDIWADATITNWSNIPGSSVDYIAVANGETAVTSSFTLLSATASYVEYNNVANKPTLVSSSNQIADITGSLITTASATGDTITFTKGDGSTFPITVFSSSSLGLNTKVGNVPSASFQATGSNDSFFDVTFATPFSSSNYSVALTNNGLFGDVYAENKTPTGFRLVSTYTTGSWGLYPGSSVDYIAVANGETAVTSSFTLLSATASYVEYDNVANKPTLVSSSNQIADITGSLISTASAAGSTITFTKGDASTFDVVITTATAESASHFAEGLVTASNDFSEITFTKDNGDTFTLDTTGNHIHELVKNKESQTLVKGTPVYVSGSTGNASHVYAASASRADRMPAAYVLDEDLAFDQEGYAVLSGFINNVNTSQFAAGDSVYVGASGGYTNVKPTGTNFIQKLGNVIKVDAANGSGVITGAGRANDVPNIQENYLWIGNADGVATPVSTGSLSGSFTLLSDFIAASSSFSTRVSTLETNDTLQDLRLDALELETGSIASEQSTQDNRLQALETKTGSLESTDTLYDGRLDSLETETGSISTEQTLQDSRLQSLETKTGSLESTDTLYDGRLDAIEAATSSYALEANISGAFSAPSSSFSTRITDLEGVDNLYDGRLDALELETGSISTEQTLQDSRLQSLETKSGSLESTDTLYDGRLDAIEAATSSYLLNTTDTLTGTLTVTNVVDASSVTIADELRHKTDEHTKLAFASDQIQLYTSGSSRVNVTNNSVSSLVNLNVTNDSNPTINIQDTTNNNYLQLKALDNASKIEFTNSLIFESGSSNTEIARLSNEGLNMNSFKIIQVQDPTLAQDAATKAYVDSTVNAATGSVDTLAEVLANGNTTGGTNISVSANDDINFSSTSEAIFNNNRLRIYESGTGAFVIQSGSGALNLRASSVILGGFGGGPMLQATEGGAVVLRHNEVLKLSTSTTGLTVSGRISSLTDPTAAQDAATKAYVDSTVNGATGSFLLNTTDTLTGDLTVTGRITAEEFHTEFISSSIIYRSGSTKFGDTADDSHDFTGSLAIDGSSLSRNILKVTGTTTNPLARFESSTNRSHIEFDNNTTSGSIGVFAATMYFDLDPAGSFGGPGAMIFAISGSQKMRIEKTGNVGIGTLTPGELLTVGGNISGSGNLVIEGNITGSAGLFSGDVDANDFITTSDRRLKSEITPIKEGLETLKQFVSYEYIKSDRQDAGFIAQEVQQAIPYAIQSGSGGYLTMRDRPILAHMHKAILELSERLEVIEQKIK
jgi:hypothetical protein